ncbi:MAG: hypothetical protein A3J71_15420 [Pseudomonadales bacterium RIFCSPHIGHO2_02_FULL_60_43]|nr:MAG: hypothetical protein A3J71_15420 [Pseudomonadales bacterium RIFCSPHIGHO2_02_FULL_60_43]
MTVILRPQAEESHGVSGLVLNEVKELLANEILRLRLRTLRGFFASALLRLRMTLPLLFFSN